MKDLDLAGMKKGMPVGAAGALHTLLGCDWGRGISHPSDPMLCMEQAAMKMVIHAPPSLDLGFESMEFKFCARHFALAESETVKSAGRVEPGSLDSSDYPNVSVPEYFEQCRAAKFTFRTGSMRCDRRAGHSSLRPHYHAATEDEWT